MRIRTALPLGVLLLAAGCQGATRAVPTAAERPATRSAVLTSCPLPVSSGVPGDLPLVDREVLNLGGGLLGHRVVFQRTTARRVVLSVGVEALDAFEDLDMDARDRTVGGRRATVSTTLFQPRLTVVELTTGTEDLPDRCAPLFAVTESLTALELDQVIAGLSFAPEPAG